MSTTSKHLQNVAIVGAGGNSGKYITEALINGGKHKVTALTRAGSASEVHPGATKVEISYDDPSTIVSALKGQDVLVITMAATAPPEQEPKLIEAAAAAGVRWILPNEYGFDSSNLEVSEAVMIRKTHIRALVSKLGKSNWIAVCTGFWYEWSVAIPLAYGFDFKDRSVTFYDDGNTKINTTTWPQVGLAVAKLLSLKKSPDAETDKSQTLEAFKDDSVYVKSFNVSQKEIFESALRVTGTSEGDWKIGHQPSKERYEQGVERMKAGDRMGFGQQLYARVLYADGSGNFIHTKKLSNEVLDLPEEDLDEATKRAIKRSQEVSFP